MSEKSNLDGDGAAIPEITETVRIDPARAAETAEISTARTSVVIESGQRRRARLRFGAFGVGVVIVAAIVTTVRLSPHLLPGQSAPSSVSPPLPHQSTATPSRSPATISDLPIGSEPQLAYWQDGRLNVGGGTSYAMPRPDNIMQGGTTVLVECHQHWTVVDPSGIVAAPALNGRSVYLAPSGSVVAWVDPSAHQSVLVAWNPHTSTTIATHTIPIGGGNSTGGGWAVEAVGIDALNRVYWTVAGQAHTRVWLPQTNEVQTVHTQRSLTRLVTKVPSQIGPLGPVYQRASGILSLRGVYGKVTASGEFVPVATTPTDQLGTWAPDGKHFVYASDPTGAALGKAPLTTMWVYDAATGATTRLRSPAGVAGSPVWESDSTVLYVAGNLIGTQYIVRCSVITKSCEIALTGSSGHRFVLSGTLP